MIGTDRFSSTFGSVPAGDADRLQRLVSAAVRNGFAVVLDRPGEKIPLCTLSVRAAKQADDEARQLAQMAGNQRWQHAMHACGVHHALTDPAKAGATVTRLVKAYGQLNIGVAPHASRMIVVDVDTAAERDAFEQQASYYGPVPGITVESPGKRAPDGTWVHHGGGHWWFYLPDGFEIPDGGLGALKGEGGWSLIWSGRQVLVPPSVRSEGPYRLVGNPTVAPGWLLERVRTAWTGHRDRAAAREVHAPGNVELWAAQNPWAVFLEPHGWSDTGMVDTCGCSIWTAPGDHASPKSATAHEPGCSLKETDGFLHVWTDNGPPELNGARDLSKLQFLAATEHGGHAGRAMGAMSLLETPSTFTIPAGWDEPIVDVPPAHEPWTPPGPLDPTGAVSAGNELERPSEGRVLDAMFDSNDLDHLPEAVPLIEGVLDRNSVAVLVGKFGTYKTFLALDWAACAATGRAWAGHEVPEAVPVLYVAAEGARGIRKRLKAWRAARQPIERGAVTVITVAARLTMVEELHQLDMAMTRTGAKFLVLDTLHKVAPGMEENSSQDMGQMLNLVNLIREKHQATILILHHTGYAGERARGSSSFEDDVDSSFVIKLPGEDRDAEQPRTLHHRKVKDGEEMSPLTLKFQPVEGTGSGVLETDPWARPGHFVPDADREQKIQAVIDVLTANGVPADLGRRRIVEVATRLGVDCSQPIAMEVARRRGGG